MPMENSITDEAELGALLTKLSLAQGVRTGLYTSIYGTKEGKFLATLEVTQDGSKIEVTGQDQHIGLALEKAWEKLRKIIKGGMDRQVLLPPVEEKVQPVSLTIDDDIPF